MDSKSYSILPSFLYFCTLFVILSTCTHGVDRKEYIVYMGHLEEQSGVSSSLLQHVSFLERALKNTSSARVIHSYKSIINGFLAHLTKDEVQQISSMQEVVSVFPNRMNHLHTTRSWDDIQFPTSVKRVKTEESNIIIGVIDSGIWPELDCFNDEGYGPPPPKWKGSCGGFTNFTCNNKIIGARYYKSDGIILKTDILSPRDTMGHGTHVASTVAGGLDSSASFYGLANGTARGGVPSSRIAVYKVCWSNGCSDHDIMIAFTDAINDGVDIISISAGRDQHVNYFQNPIGIGSFHAMRVGILTVATAGNLGPTAGTVSNVAPWGISVAATTTSRKFYTTLKLGDGTTFQGIAISISDTNDFSPIVYAGNVPNRELNIHGSESRYCRNNSLDAVSVKNKIVVCDGLNSGEAVLLAGAAGMVIHGDGPKDTANVFALPTTYVDSKSGRILMNYISTARNPTARLFKSNEIIERFEPSTASFSSRGPNLLTSHILKPDLSAPGVSILAAWTLAKHSPEIVAHNGRSAYNIMSGTSMACPHVSAAAAYVKSFNPSWHSEYIKSALITTAIRMSWKLSMDAEFGYGAGLIDPVKAIDPGLVYNASQHDYVQFLCGHGYKAYQLRVVIGGFLTCNGLGIENILNLNLPSFQYRANPRTPFKVFFHRRVTNVGPATSTYKAVIVAPMALKIQVAPTTLSFNSIGQTLFYNMVVGGTVNGGKLFNGILIWASATHNVSSPIVVYA